MFFNSKFFSDFRLSPLTWTFETIEKVPQKTFFVETTKEGAIYSVDAPGADPAKITVSVEQGQLFAGWARGSTKHAHICYVDEALDPDTIDASVKNGVLSVSFKKKAETQVRKTVPVKAL